VASSLEEHYLKILGNPEEGNLPELEKKFKRKSAEYLVTKTEGRVDISLIQRSGELTSAYLYLKAKWEINSNGKPFVPRILRIENPEQEQLTFLEKLHIKLSSISIAGLFFIGIISLYQFGSSFLDSPLANSFSTKHDYQVLANLIVEENELRNNVAAKTAEKLKVKRETFVRKVDQKSITPIHAAARSCNLGQLSSKINTSSSINALDGDGATPLHWTSRINCVKGSELLINAGANLSIKDQSGRTPLDWAKFSNNHESVRLLEKAGALR